MWVIIVDLDLAVHVPVDDLRHVGPAARAAEGGAFPDPPVTSWKGRVSITALPGRRRSRSTGPSRDGYSSAAASP
jgi:hypothetical protein